MDWGEPPAPSLYYLRTFHAVADLRSFTRAGHQLGLSQPAVSAHVRALERYYHAPLFQVSHRRVSLTAAGEALFGYTQRVFHLLGQADRAVAATRRAEQGRLLLGASASLGIYLLPPVLATFTRARPGLEVEVAIGTSGEVAARVLAEQVPFGLVEAPVVHRDLEVTPFGEDDMVLIAPADHPWARTGSLEPAALAGQPLLRREAGSGTQALVDAALEQAGLALPTAMRLGSTEALKQAVLAGVGVAWVPRTTVRREIAAGQLAAPAVASLTIRRSLSLVRPRDSGLALPPAAEPFLALVREAAARTLG